MSLWSFPHKKKRLIGITALAALLPSLTVFAHTPDSKVVRGLIDRAVRVLETEDHNDPGGKALIAMALLKAGVQPGHPKIQQGVASVRRFVAGIKENGIGNHCYNAAVCSLFLMELNPVQYRSDIETLLQGIAYRQRQNGSWNYANPQDYEDTSQTQYCVLALWAGHMHGFTIESHRIVSAVNFFIRTQETGGGWTYRAREPQTGQKVEQLPPTLSMSAAGPASSVYICGSLIGFGRHLEQPKKGIPPALRIVGRPNTQTRFLSSDGVNQSQFRSTITRANNWFASRTVFSDDEVWVHYYMYGLERYKSFQSLFEGTGMGAEPKWYNDGVDYLRDTQEPNGGWISKHSQSPLAISTAFAVLFLTRSTAVTIQRLEGSLRGGRDMPRDISQVRIDETGRLFDAREPPPIEALLKRLELEDAIELDFSLPLRLELSENPQARAAQVARLRRLATRGPFEARRMAVNTLGRDRDFGHVPALIYALSDPDLSIALAAQDGLRFISRKLDSFALSANPTVAERKEAQAKWSEWYLTVQSGGTLIE